MCQRGLAGRAIWLDLVCMADMDRDLTARPTYTLRSLPPESARYHAQILRAAADLLLAGEPVWWMQPEYPDNKRGITYLFDADALRTATVAVWNRVAAGEEDYVIKVKPEELTKPRSRKRR